MTNTPHTPKVSVIVAAYQAEKYLERCLQSIASQTLTDFEVIIVDDGSTDGTAEIADRFTQEDSRFRIFRQKNKGVSAARQTGIDQAAGKYTIHADADDWIEQEMLQTLVSKAEAESADMVICDFLVHFSEKETEYWKQEPVSCDHMTVMGQTFRELYGSLWNRLIKRSCYQKYSITFDTSLQASEDQMVVLSLLAQPLTVAYVGQALYHYDRSQNESSLVNSRPLIKERLYVLEAISEKYDISSVQAYYDNAILHLAYDALFVDSVQSSYRQLFSKHEDSIRRAQGFPWRVKTLVLLRIRGIRVPIGAIKKFFHR